MPKIQLFDLPYCAYKNIFSFLEPGKIEEIVKLSDIPLRLLALVRGIIEEQLHGRIRPENLEDCCSPPDQLRILDAIYDFSAPAAAYPFRVTKISYSLSPWATVLKLEINQQSFIIRILHAARYPSSDIAQAEIRKEILINHIVGHSDYAPLVHYANYATGVIITEYIEHIPVSDWKDDIGDFQLRLLVDLLKKIEQESLLRLIPRRDPTKFTYIFERAENNGKIINPKLYQQIRDRYLDLKKELEITASGLTLIHHDFTPWNVLFTGSNFFIVDWEYAQPSNILYDLATMAFFLKLTPPQEQRLLSYFFSDSTLTTSILRDYYLYKELTCLTCCIFCFGMYEGKAEPFPDLETESIPAYSQIPGKTEAGNRESSIGRLRNCMSFFGEGNLAHKSYEETLTFSSTCSVLG